MHKSKSTATGNVGESIACIFLERKGFRILARNYSRPWGEIDVVAIKNNIVRFVEVKTLTIHDADISREMNSYRPEEQIHQAKLRKIVRTAQAYMSRGKDAREFQIDAVGVILDQRTRIARCRLYEQVI